jgi:prepilin-type N-terminal cleavage/methylation domain-containing protein
MKTPEALNRGMTLIELSIALLVMSLVLGSGLSLLRTQLELQKIKDTQRTLDEIKEALLGYAINQTPAHLPCPDKTGGAGAGTANDGLEDVTLATGICVTQEGNIPWATLGVPQTDAWGNRIHYRVTNLFSNRSPAASLTLASTGTLRVCQAAGCATVISNTVPAVMLSYGKNGFGAITAASAVLPAPAGADEAENTNSDDDFVSHSPSGPGAPAGEFDDIVSWLSSGVLFNRLVAAGKLP